MSVIKCLKHLGQNCTQGDDTRLTRDSCGFITNVEDNAEHGSEAAIKHHESLKV